MDLRTALKEQYHAGLAMLAECIEACPDDLWLARSPEQPTTTFPPEGAWAPRTVWRIAYHTLFFTHNYLVQDEEAFNRSVPKWPAPVRASLIIREGQRAIEVEPYELPDDAPPLSRSQVLEYHAYVDSLVDETIDALDLDRADTGFSWYPDMTKLSHQLMNLRHIQGHVGQLSELLMGRGIDTHWVGKR